MPADYSIPVQIRTIAADHSYEDNDELEISVGDTIRNVKDIGNGWLFGSNKRTGKTGIFPKECVKKQSSMQRSGQDNPADINENRMSDAFTLAPLTGELSSLISRIDEIEALSIEDTEIEHSIRLPSIRKEEVKHVGIATETQASRSKKKLFKGHMDGLKEKYVMKIIREVSLHKPNKKKSDEVQLKDFNNSNNNKSCTVDQCIQTGNKSIKNPQKRNQCSRVFLSVITGLCQVVVLFLALRFCIRYTLVESSSIAGVSCLLLGLVLAVSDHAPCVITLMGVSVFTGNGRILFLAFVTGGLLMGPALNIVNNANEVANSQRCLTELTSNQSLARERRAAERHIQQVALVEDIAGNVQNHLDGLQKLLGNVKQRLIKVKGAGKRAMDAANNECQTSMIGVFTSCATYSQASKTQCTSLVSKVEHSAQNILDEVSKVIDPANWFGRKRRSTLEKEELTVHQNRYKRASISNSICKIFDASNICDGLNNIDWCSPVELIGKRITTALAKVTDELTNFENKFRFRLTKLETADNSSGQMMNQNKNGARPDFQMMMDSVIVVITVISRMLSCLVLITFLQVVLCHRRYLRSLSHENVYITGEMGILDKAIVAEGVRGLFPLHKHERELYVDATSARLSPVESRKWRCGMTTLLMHVLVAVVVCTIDHLIYYAVYVPQDPAEAQLGYNLSSNPQINLAVEGSGPVADIFKVFVRNGNFQEDYDDTPNIRACLPSANLPSISNQFLVAGLYCMWFACVVLQAYGLRVHRKITALYYPERESHRTAWLYRHIHAKRGNCCVEMNITRNRADVVPDCECSKLNYSVLGRGRGPRCERPRVSVSPTRHVMLDTDDVAIKTLPYL